MGSNVGQAPMVQIGSGRGAVGSNQTAAYGSHPANIYHPGMVNYGSSAHQSVGTAGPIYYQNKPSFQSNQTGGNINLDNFMDGFICISTDISVDMSTDTFVDISVAKIYHKVPLLMRTRVDF